MTNRIIPPDEILKAYTNGYFPMADSKKAGAPIYLYTAQKRGIIPLDQFHLSRRSLRFIKTRGFEWSINQDFEGVITGCADRATTWISPEIRNTFLHLHESGYAHSLEITRNDTLVGGLYGLAIGGAFFAESVFQREPEAHKAAMYFFHQHLTSRGYSLWDVQFYTKHLGRFGCIEIPDLEYRKLLGEALQLECRFD